MKWGVAGRGDGGNMPSQPPQPATAPVAMGSVVAPRGASVTMSAGGANSLMPLPAVTLPLAPAAVSGRPPQHVAMPYAGPTTAIPVGGLCGLQQQPQPLGSLGLQAPKGLPMPQPLQMPQLNAFDDLMETSQRNAINLKAQNELAAKDRQLEDLSRYAVSLQQVLQAERSKRMLSEAQIAPQASPEAALEVQRFSEEAAATVADCVALSADMGKAAEIAAQLNAWFMENATKMRTQESWASPSAYLEKITAELKQQFDGLTARLVQAQMLLNAESTEQAATPGSRRRPMGSSAAAAGSTSALPVNVQSVPLGVQAQALGSGVSVPAGTPGGSALFPVGLSTPGGQPAAVQVQQPCHPGQQGQLGQQVQPGQQWQQGQQGQQGHQVQQVQQLQQLQQQAQQAQQAQQVQHTHAQMQQQQQDSLTGSNVQSASGPQGGTPRHSHVPPVQGQPSLPHEGTAAAYTPSRVAAAAVMSPQAAGSAGVVPATAASTPSPRAAVSMPIQARGFSAQISAESPQKNVVRFSTEGPSVHFSPGGAAVELGAEELRDTLSASGLEDSQLDEDGGTPAGFPSYTSFHISKTH